MAADFENMGYETEKTCPRIRLKVPEALRPIPELKMAVDFENMGCEGLPKTVSRIKMAAKSD